MRVGFGYDIHRLVKERDLILAGIKIPYRKGLLGHSDGDVVLHAIADAILGALNKNDIGKYFPCSDSKFTNISSTVIISKVIDIMKKENYEINNMDTTIVTEKPFLQPYISIMKKSLAKILRIKQKAISIKSKTNEGIGEIGRNKAIACYTVVLLLPTG